MRRRGGGGGGEEEEEDEWGGGGGEVGLSRRCFEAGRAPALVINFEIACAKVGEGQSTKNFHRAAMALSFLHLFWQIARQVLVVNNATVLYARYRTISPLFNRTFIPVEL